MARFRHRQREINNGRNFQSFKESSSSLSEDFRACVVTPSVLIQRFQVRPNVRFVGSKVFAFCEVFALELAAIMRTLLPAQLTLLSPIPRPLSAGRPMRAVRGNPFFAEPALHHRYEAHVEHCSALMFSKLLLDLRCDTSNRAEAKKGKQISRTLPERAAICSSYTL